MEEFTYLLAGGTILVLVIYDFFFTTLSGSGAGFIAEKVLIIADKIAKLLVKLMGRKAYKVNGLFVNLMLLTTWILLVWSGLFLVYSYDPEAIVNASGRVANLVERLYFTGYIISTLGIGNFKPSSELFEVVTSCFAFFGFIFFTSSMTYFISVSSALVNKRALAKSMFNLGENPQEICRKLLSLDSSYSYQQLLSLQEMIDRHSANHHAYPVIHFFTEIKPKNCFSLNLARFDEALSILIGSSEGKKLHKELAPVRSSITSFLETLDKSYSKSMPTVKNPVNPFRFSYQGKVVKNEQMAGRRRILEELFRSEGFRWEDVT